MPRHATLLTVLIGLFPLAALPVAAEDGQSFFVRHVSFLHGGKETKEGPYDKLKKALRAEIDEGEWSKLYSATSQPFDPPKSGKIAVKVINHFGDEVLKVYPVPTNGTKK